MSLNKLAEAFLAANKNRLSSNTLLAYSYDLTCCPGSEGGEIYKPPNAS